MKVLLFQFIFFDFIYFKIILFVFYVVIYKSWLLIKNFQWGEGNENQINMLQDNPIIATCSYYNFITPNNKFNS